jgi:hypothetical protein
MPCHDKVVAVAHAADGLDDFSLVILDNLDPFELLLLLCGSVLQCLPFRGQDTTYDSQAETPFGKVVRVGLSTVSSGLVTFGKDWLDSHPWSTHDFPVSFSILPAEGL